MIQTTGATRSPRTGMEQRGWKRFVFAGLFAAAVLVLFLAPFLRYGAVVGEEFTPQRFQRRSYNYWEVPLIHVQITPLKRQNETNELETYLTQKKLVPVSGRSQPSWDLVTVRRADVAAAPGDALILCRYLDLKNSDGHFVWLEWTKANQGLAKVFWPTVAEAARCNMYVLTPDLFHLAQRATDQVIDAQNLKRQLAEHLAARYLEAALVQQQLDKHDRAIELFDIALRHNPALDGAKNGRRASLPLRSVKSGQSDVAR